MKLPTDPTESEIEVDVPDILAWDGTGPFKTPKSIIVLIFVIVALGALLIAYIGMLGLHWSLMILLQVFGGVLMCAGSYFLGASDENNYNNNHTFHMARKYQAAGVSLIIGNLPEAPKEPEKRTIN